MLDAFKSREYELRFFPSPLPDKIKYSKEFEKSMDNSTVKQKTHLCQINNRIDDLGRFILSNKSLKRFDIKKLKGQALEKYPDGYEIDLWSTGGGWRLFCHFDEGLCILDEVSEHLK